MTVTELIEFLKYQPENALVVLSKDAEGNIFSPLASLSEGNYVAETTWRGEFTDDDDGAESNAICLWPTN